jgi:LacI family transcriptional regulator
VKIDLKQLSNHLGLSPTTVSRALNGYSEVSEETRDRVRKVAAELGYQPNSVAKRLARGRADAIGLVYPLDAADLGDPRFLELIEGISDKLAIMQMDFLLASASESSELRTYERLVSGGRVDGFIVSRTLVEDSRIAYLMRLGVPFVAHGRTMDSRAYSWLDFDNEVGMAKAVEACISLGHQRIAYLHAPLKLNFAFQRRSGFESAMHKAGLSLNSNLILESGMSRRSGYAAALSLLQMAPRPTAIVIDNNLCGVGVVRALLDEKIAIGSEVSIVVYDGVPTDTLLNSQSIASIEQPTPYETGKTIAELLLNQIGGDNSAPSQVLRQPIYVAGGSMGKAPE